MNELPEFNGWQGTRALGAGRCGETFEIERDDGFGAAEHGALKLISIEATSDAEETARLRSQLENMSRVLRASESMSDSKNILPWRDHAIRRYADGSGWEISLRTDLAVPLERYIRSHTYGETDVARIGAGVCNALVLCRDRGIVHGDVKPENIFVSGGNFEGSLDVRLGDFGMSALVQDAAGDFAAPEVLCGEAPSAENDVYSVGMVLYWMLNDRRIPFAPLPPEGVSGSDLAIARDMRLRGDPMPKPLHGSAALQTVIMKAISDQPADRYPTAEALRDALLNAVHRPSAAAASAAAAGAAVVAGTGAAASKPAKAPKLNKTKPAKADKPVVEEDEDDGEATGGKGLKIAAWVIGAIAGIALIALLASVLFGGGSKKVEDTFTLTLSLDEAEIAPDETLKLIAELRDQNDNKVTNPDITWRSSNSRIAEVDDKGIVTAGDEGTAKITAECEGQTAECKVTVTKDAIKITNVELDTTTAEMKVGEELTLNVKLTPEDAKDDNIKWSSSFTRVATVKDGVVKAVGPGETTITARANGHSATCKVTVKPTAEIRSVSCPTGSVSLSNTGASATVTFTVTGSDLGTVANSAKVYPVDGSIVQVGALQRSAGTNADTYTVTLTGLAEGATTVAFEITDANGVAHSATCSVVVSVPATPTPEQPTTVPTAAPTVEPTAEPTEDTTAPETEPNDAGE